MITAREKITKCSNSIFVKEEAEKQCLNKLIEIVKNN